MKNFKWYHIAAAAFLLFGGIVSLGFSDYAETKFWWTFWDIYPWVSLAGFVVFVAYINKLNKKQ